MQESPNRMPSPLHRQGKSSCQYINPYLKDKTCKGAEKSSLFWLDNIRTRYMQLDRRGMVLFVDDMIIQAHACLHKSFHNLIIAALGREKCVLPNLEDLRRAYKVKNSHFVCTCGSQITREIHETREGHKTYKTTDIQEDDFDREIDIMMKTSSTIRKRLRNRKRTRRGRRKKKYIEPLIEETEFTYRKIDGMSIPLRINSNTPCQHINPHFNDKTCTGGEKSSLFWLDEIRNVYMHLHRREMTEFVRDMVTQAHPCLHNSYHKTIIAALRSKDRPPRTTIEKLYVAYKTKNSLFVCTCELGCQLSLNKVMETEHLLLSEVSTNSNILSTKFQDVDNSVAEANWKPLAFYHPQASSQAPSAPKWPDVVAQEAFDIGKAFSVLFSICEYLGFLGPSLHSIIMRALDFGSDDTASIKAFFKDADTLKIMSLVEEKLTTLLREFYQDIIKREMFMSAIGHIKLILNDEQSYSSQQCQQQQSMQGSHERGPQGTGNGYKSQGGDYCRTEDGNKCKDSEYSRNRLQDYTRDKQPESIDYGHQHPGNADYDRKIFRIGDYDRDKYSEPRRPNYYDVREIGSSSDYRQFSDHYRIEEYGGSIDANRGQDRGPPEYGRDFANHDRHLLSSDYGNDTPGSSLQSIQSPVTSGRRTNRSIRSFKKRQRYLIESKVSTAPSVRDFSKIMEIHRQDYGNDTPGSSLQSIQSPVTSSRCTTRSLRFSKARDKYLIESKVSTAPSVRDFSKIMEIHRQDYGNDTPGSSGYDRDPQGPLSDDRLQSNAGYWR